MINIIKAIIFDLDGVIFNNVNFQGKTRNEKYIWSRSIEKDLGLTQAHIEQAQSNGWKAFHYQGNIDDLSSCLGFCTENN